MNLFQLVLKQMRQRALSTWLTLLSIVLGVALAVAIMILYREGSDLFVQKDYGYEVIVGPPKGSPLQLVLNTVYQIDVSPGNIPYKVYEDLLKNRGDVKNAIPYAVGDSYKGLRLVGTAPKLFNFDEAGQPLPPERTFEYQKGRSYQLAEGKVFAPNRFEAVIGSDVPERAGLKIGETFQASHGLPASGAAEEEDVHDTKWTVVGRLKKTHTAADRLIFIPLQSFYAISEHEEALENQARMKAGLPPLPPKPKVEPKPGPAHDEHDHPATRATPATPTAAHDEHAPAPAGAVPATGHTGHDDHAPTAGAAPATAHAAHDDHDHPPAGARATPPPAAPRVAVGPQAHMSPPAAAPAADAHDDHKFELNPDGTFTLHLPKENWVVSAVLVKTRSSIGASRLLYQFKVIDPNAIAVNPAEVMRQFFDTFLKRSTTVLLLISILVILVAAIGILVAIYNSVSARIREIAILRALGATRTRILTLICLEAGLIGLIGGVVGALAGHLLAAAGSAYMNRIFGQSLRWFSFDLTELYTLLGVVAIAVLAGLVPAVKAYRVPVASNLAAS